MGRAEQEIDILERISQILGDGLEMGQLFQRAMSVLCEKLDGTLMPALCYISPETELAPATDEYLDRIVEPARDLDFPQWYIDRIEAFRS